MPRVFFYCFLFLFLIAALRASAMVASSTNYAIEVDSINTAGATSSSGNYAVADSSGQASSGLSTSTNFNIRAGYRRMVDSYLAITSPSDLNLRTVSSTGGLVDGSATWKVTTDNSGGYTITIQSATNPTLVGPSSFSDYSPSVVGVPDYEWSVESSAAEFGFSPEGTDISTTYKDNGSSCNTGSNISTFRCWDGLSTTAKEIVNTFSPNHPNGVDTTVRFRGEVGGDRGMVGGNYSASVTVTALSQ